VKVSWDGPYWTDTLRRPIYICEACGALVDEYSLDTHVRFHDRVEARQA